jgi:predicted HD phosphohydrolase
VTGNTLAGPRFASADAFCDALLAFLDLAGRAHYEETVTQLDHATQAASLAVADGADDALVVAALLHDIGMLLLDGREGPGDGPGDRPVPPDAYRGAPLLRHEAIGARFLARWFDADVVAPVALHVTAKRYLVATDAGYADRLSPASRRSLAAQGGPLPLADAARFAGRHHAGRAVALRRWDDDAKVVGAAGAPLGRFEARVRAQVRPPAGGWG